MEQIEEPKIQESSPEYKSPSKKNSKVNIYIYTNNTDRRA